MNKKSLQGINMDYLFNHHRSHGPEQPSFMQRHGKRKVAVSLEITNIE
jgi:hypothetical protein